MVGERPPSGIFGWPWFCGDGFTGDGDGDVVLGVREIETADDLSAAGVGQCSTGPYHFMPGTLDNMCDVLHFWSLHSGGANFVFADGSVHFLSYSAGDVMPQLATRRGGEVVELP